MLPFSPRNIAIGRWTLSTWHAVTLELAAKGRHSRFARINAFREVWTRRMPDREARAVDMRLQELKSRGEKLKSSTFHSP